MGKHLDKMQAYMDAVESGERPAGRLERLAVRRHLFDLETQDSRPIKWEPAVAEAGCSYFPMILRHGIGEWYTDPFELTEFQCFLIASVHGWRRRDTYTKKYPHGFRRFTRAYVETARKSGKSNLGGGVALQMATADYPPEPQAWINMCATKIDQVKKTTYGAAIGIINASPWLETKLTIRTNKILVSKDDQDQPGSMIVPIASDGGTSDGDNTSGAIIDELHAWKECHDELYQKVTTAGGSRRQELVWFFTTAGSDESELWIKLREDVARAVEAVESESVVADHIFGMICCIDDDDDPLSLDCESDEYIQIMRKANPNYPETPKRRYLIERGQEAQGSDLERNKFLRFHANRRVASSVQPFTEGALKACAIPEGEPPEESWLGLDLGRANDFAAWSVVYMEDGQVRIVSRSYTCEDRPEALKTWWIEKWISDGWLIEHKDNQVDFGQVTEDVLRVVNQYNVQRIAYDEWAGKVVAQKLVDELGEDRVIRFVQNPRTYNEPCQLLVKCHKRGEMAPDADPCLLWQFRNTSFSEDNQERWMPEKGISKKYKIDGAVAAIMAYGLMLLTESTTFDSFYDDNEVGMF